MRPGALANPCLRCMHCRVLPHQDALLYGASVWLRNPRTCENAEGLVLGARWEVIRVLGICNFLLFDEAMGEGGAWISPFVAPRGAGGYLD